MTPTSIFQHLEALGDEVESGLVKVRLVGVGRPRGMDVHRLLAVHGVQPQVAVLLRQRLERVDERGPGERIIKSSF